MMKTVYMVIGCPASGKSWVCQQLTEQYAYVPHDSYMDKYIAAIVQTSKTATKPLLVETPFSISQLKEPLEEHGYQITPVFIQEAEQVLRDRYYRREGKHIPEGHVSRQITYATRAKLWQSFVGTSAEVLAHLKGKEEKWPWS